MVGRYKASMCVAVVEELFGANVAKVFASLQREPSGLPPILVRLKGQINLGQVGCLYTYYFLKIYNLLQTYQTLAFGVCYFHR